MRLSGACGRRHNNTHASAPKENGCRARNPDPRPVGVRIDTGSAHQFLALANGRIRLQRPPGALDLPYDRGARNRGFCPHKDHAAQRRRQHLQFATRQLCGRGMTASAIGRLTERQKACLRLVGQGYTSKEIGRHLGISPATVDNHIRAVLDALQAETRQEAARLLATVEASQPLTRPR